VNNRKCTLLVVDDEPYILPTLANLLGGEYDVVTADSADAAEAVFARQPVHIILTDQKMPRRTGIQLLEWVRDHHPGTVRLLMTGYAELDDAVEAINRGQVYHYLLKPWRTEELLHILRNAADKYFGEVSRAQLFQEVQDKNLQLEQLNSELEQRVLERTQQLEATNAILQQRSKELEQAYHLLQQRTLELERLALTDPLTGLFNRRAMDELARFELKRHARYPSPLTLGLVDVDHFKHVNTQFLYTGGDAVLKGLARILSSSLREVDSVGRLGGEEFLVIARETGEEGARHLAERIRATVAGTPIPYSEHAITITVSIGLAVAEVGIPVEYDIMMRAAAAALQEAKNDGRNCVRLNIIEGSSSPV
jgi:diguanylate cyclase (GGDEF)-like protein